MAVIEAYADALNGANDMVARAVGFLGLGVQVRE
jgi:hypothetical protein